MIRHATLQDYDRIIELMTHFADAAPVVSLNNPRPDVRRLQHFLAGIQQSGVILVAEEADDLQGMLIAQTQPDSWLPYVRTLRELAWWVEPEYRNTTMGYRLLQHYKQTALFMKQQGHIDQFTITLMENSPQLDLEKRGWTPIETNYIFNGE